MNLDRKQYHEKCRQRWHGFAYQDALSNWEDFEELKPELIKSLREFKSNPFQRDLTGKCHNPEGQLSSFLWKLQASYQPDKSRLHPFLDFEEKFQVLFLRRGLVIYCVMILNELDALAAPNPDQAILALD